MTGVSKCQFPKGYASMENRLIDYDKTNPIQHEIIIYYMAEHIGGVNK